VPADPAEGDSMAGEAVQDDSGFSAEEEAFFESGGESELPEGEVESVSPDGPGDGIDPDAPKEGAKPPAKTAAADAVPLATFLSEKNARKALEKSQAEMAAKIANFEGKFSILERLNKPAGEVDPNAPKVPPTAEEDIFGAVKHTNETLAQMQKRLDAADQAAKETNERNAFLNDYKADAANFEAKTPDFKAGYSFLLATRMSELMAIGYENPKALQEAGASPQEVQAAAKALHDAIIADEYAIAQMAKQKGKSAAEILYGLAKQRGYKPATAKPGAKSDAEKLLENIEKGQNANKSLNGTGGSSGDADMTAERLLAMPMDEFETWCEKNPKKAQRLMGG
jgi:hypothetical protein